MITHRTSTLCLAALAVTSVLCAAAAGEARVASRQSTEETAIRRVLDDYIGLYRTDTLERWKTLFLPTFTATYTNDDGSVTARTLEDFYERQRAGFARGEMSETLDNIRITRVGRLAQAFADFRFTSAGTTRHGQLMLALIEEKGQFKIAALTFTYHLR